MTFIELAWRARAIAQRDDLETRIRALMNEAIAAGDHEAAEFCRDALAPGRFELRGIVAFVIAMVDDATEVERRASDVRETLDRVGVPSSLAVLGASVAAEIARSEIEGKKKPRACRICGCTDAKACEGGCSWVGADLCSACLDRTTGVPSREEG